MKGVCIKLNFVPNWFEMTNAGKRFFFGALLSIMSHDIFDTTGICESIFFQMLGAEANAGFRPFCGFNALCLRERISCWSRIRIFSRWMIQELDSLMVDCWMISEMCFRCLIGKLFCNFVCSIRLSKSINRREWSIHAVILVGFHHVEFYSF